MGALLNQISAEANLMSAWLAVRKKRVNTVSPAHLRFEQTVATSIAQIAADLASGTWIPRPSAKVAIPRSDGSPRLLRIPGVSDRVVHRAILNVIDPIIDSYLLPWVFGYRKGLGVRDAVHDLIARREAGDRFVIRADINDCFDLIPHDPLLQQLAPILDDPELLSIIAKILKASHPEGLGVGQGGPLAPLLSNIYLAIMDNAMSDRGLHVIRYADDLALPTADLATARRALTDLEACLDSIHLCLEPTKTRIHDLDEDFELLGVRISPLMSATVKRFDNPVTATLYVTAPGTYLRKRGERLRITTESSERNIGLDRIRQVVVLGPAGLTTPVLTAILERGIELSLLSEQGRYFGRIQGPTTGDPNLRAAQYRRGEVTHACLEVARRIVAAKVTNQRNLLLRRQRAGGQHLGKSPSRLAELRDKCRSSSRLTSLLGVEGAASRVYFQALGILFEPHFVFEGRRRRPPPDPVNSMLSFGYTLLLQEMIGAIELAGLDPSEGVLHSRLAGRPSLALDLMEEFRAVIVDTTVLGLVKRGSVSEAAFTFSDSIPQRCTMTKNSREAFIRAYEQRMLTIATHPGTGRRVSYRVMLALQAKGYATELRDPSQRWQPIVWK